MPHKIKVSDEEFTELFDSMSYPELAKHLGFTTGYIYVLGRMLGLSKTRPEKINPNIIPGGLPHRENCDCPSCGGITILSHIPNSLVKAKKPQPGFCGPSLGF